MPYVPNSNPRSLINKPSQDLLSQTYGGGSFQSPPTLNAKVIPNATGLINNPANPATPTQPGAGAPSGQIKQSPLKEKTTGGQAEGATTKSPDVEKGHVIDRQDPMYSNVVKGISAAAPGMAGMAISAWDKVLDLFGIDFGIVGPVTKELRAEAGYRQGVRDQFQNPKATVSDMEVERGRKGTANTGSSGGMSGGGGNLTSRARSVNAAQASSANARHSELGQGGRSDTGGIGGGGGHGVDSSGRHDEL